MGFSKREYWSGLPFPTPGNLPNPRIEPVSLASPALAGGFFTTANQCHAHDFPVVMEQGLKPETFNLYNSETLDQIESTELKL